MQQDSYGCETHNEQSKDMPKTRNIFSLLVHKGNTILAWILAAVMHIFFLIRTTEYEHITL